MEYKGLQIKEASGGIAVFDGTNTVYINKHLLKYPDLLNSVLQHELEHYIDSQNEKTQTQSWLNLIKTEIKDFIKEDKQTQLFGFQIKHPDAFLPIMTYHDNGKKYRIIILNQLILITFLTFFVLLIIFLINAFP